MKNKVLIFIVLLVFSLSGCTSADPIEDIEFNMEFEQLDLEKDVATFIVEGYPNNKEFEQISDVIVDSLDNQDVNSVVKVSVYSSFQDVGEDDPFYGTVIYKDGELIDNKLDQKTEEAFLELV